MKRSKDPLTAATTSVVLPALKPLGFVRVKTRIIGRLRNDILQFLSFQLSGYGGKDFCVNYASLSLFRPREFFSLDGRLTKHLKHGGIRQWWSAKTHEAADNSMADIVSTLQEELLPWFNGTDTVSGLLEYLNKQNWSARHHLEFERACCLARLDIIDDARKAAERALHLYQEDWRDWCKPYAAWCKKLIGSIDSDRYQDTLMEWRQLSIDKLKLQWLVEKQDK